MSSMSSDRASCEELQKMTKTLMCTVCGMSPREVCRDCACIARTKMCSRCGLEQTNQHVCLDVGDQYLDFTVRTLLARIAFKICSLQAKTIHLPEAERFLRKAITQLESPIINRGPRSAQLWLTATRATFACFAHVLPVVETTQR
jgi:hypothetical protein